MTAPNDEAKGTNAGRRCLICDSSQHSIVCLWDSRQVVKCLGCGVLFTEPCPSEEELIRLYNDGSLLGETNDAAVVDLLTCPEWKTKEHSRHLDGLGRLGVRRGSLLDVGCLWGFFLTHARQRGFDVVGVEPHARAVRYVQDVLKLAVCQGNLRSAAFSPSSFDVVAFLDVIEHLMDPVAELREALRVTKPKGLVLVVTPNSAGLLPQAIGIKRKAFHQPWCPIDGTPWHLWGFTRRTIALCVEKAGFRVERVELIEPSVKTSNMGAGSTSWKKMALRILGEASWWLRMSDRMVAFARKD